MKMLKVIFKEEDGHKKNTIDSYRLCNFLGGIGQKFKIMYEHDHQLKLGPTLRNIFKNSIKDSMNGSLTIRRLNIG